MTRATHDNTLGIFLRTRREQLQPQQLGLQAGNRRRVAGLRREEVASLCGISTTWLTWIEQGRTQAVSSHTLSRLAGALQLNAAERAYLFDLAGQKDPAPLMAAHAIDHALLQAATANISTPAYVLDGLWQVLSWNQAAGDLFSGWLDQSDTTKNLLHFMFLQPLAQRLVADWPLRAQRMVAEFRAEHSRLEEHAEASALVDSLRAASPEFAQLWQQQAVQAREGGSRRFMHDSAGELHFQQLTLRLAPNPELKLVMLLPEASSS